MIGFGTSCGACKFLRRKCTNCCVFAPYFCYDQAATHFAAVHKVYGASNVSRLLSHLPILNRGDAAITITYEALARMQDPVYGCVAHIYALQQQVASLQEEIEIFGSLMVNSTFDEVNCGSVQAPMDSNNTIQYHPLQHDAANTRTEYYQNQMTNILSHQGSATMHQIFNSHMGKEQLPRVHDKLEEPLFDDDSNSINPLEKFLSGIDQEGFMNHPWFKHNADIIRN